MDSSYRPLIIGTVAVAIALMVLFPRDAIVIFIVWVVCLGTLSKFAFQRVDEPNRPVISRWGQLHRLGTPGIFSLMPWIETVAGVISVKPISQDFTVNQITTSDGESVYFNLEITWRLRPELVIIDELVKQFLLKDEDQRKRMVEQSMCDVSRHLLLNFTTQQTKRADSREHIILSLRTAINDYLAPHGVLVETIFWRGSVTAKEINEAKTRIKVEREHLQAFIEEVQMVQRTLPNIPAEEFLAYQAWLELIRRGVSPPGVPGMPQFPISPPMTAIPIAPPKPKTP